MPWLSENLSTIIICMILAVIVGLIIISMVRNKKKGKCSCGNDCGCCPMGGSCHGGAKKER
ncbi:MAG: FeoB-associated Cys-rich membrane protein [Bacteroides sp.]|nr:FeoB-associated Cys-rich membrane protein [Bacteroides sp.]